MSEVTMARLLALPEAAQTTDTKTFTLKGEDWTFTIHTGAREHAEAFYPLIACMSKAVEECKSGKGVTFYPQPDIEICVNEPGYLGSLYVLSEVLVEPAFCRQSVDNCALLGHKFGLDFEEVLDWAAGTNGVTGYFLNKYLEISKNEFGAEDLKSKYSAPVSKSVTRTRSKH